MSLELYIDGGWIASAATEWIEVLDPATGKSLADVPAGDAADVDRAVRAARRAFPDWAATAPPERAAFVSRLADELARTLHGLCR
ncbi:aldehyde dehydrogenase family protein [Pseudonocardia sp. HH130629-09]|uniref:aldehyde dehydrogenase family protein n=1 Tax=Pseudonocardia sp. HH130629-09 TaxID=1641402 RepID=UPI0006CB7CBF|nr:aldehyde dehydrogenase family protein [Pseudonocardia sp. HH130629-09]ALE82191.1 hypothetical protein XF36_02765 [Pseudonocardia sp. HH130629-09]